MGTLGSRGAPLLTTVSSNSRGSRQQGCRTQGTPRLLHAPLSVMLHGSGERKERGTMGPPAQAGVHWCGSRRVGSGHKLSATAVSAALAPLHAWLAVGPGAGLSTPALARTFSTAATLLQRQQHQVLAQHRGYTGSPGGRPRTTHSGKQPLSSPTGRPTPGADVNPAALAADEAQEASSTTVLLAFFGNAAITLMKAAMWWRSGSSAMLAETVHTLVSGHSARAKPSTQIEAPCMSLQL